MTPTQMFVVAILTAVAGVVTGIGAMVPAIILARANARVLLAGIKEIKELTTKASDKAETAVNEAVLLKAVAIETRGLVNHQALINLEVVERLTKKIAESGDPRDKESWRLAVKAVEDHKTAQAKLDSEAKQAKDDARAESLNSMKQAVAESNTPPKNSI